MKKHFTKLFANVLKISVMIFVRNVATEESVNLRQTNVSLIVIINAYLVIRVKN